MVVIASTTQNEESSGEDSDLMENGVGKSEVSKKRACRAVGIKLRKEINARK